MTIHLFSKQSFASIVSVSTANQVSYTHTRFDVIKCVLKKTQSEKRVANEIYISNKVSSSLCKNTVNASDELHNVQTAKEEKKTNRIHFILFIVPSSFFLLFIYLRWQLQMEIVYSWNVKRNPMN